MSSRFDKMTTEEKERDKRYHRDARLKATDKYMLADFPITSEQLEELKIYRQALRDMPEDENWLENDYPEKPDWI